jgi:hypothetical protein
MSSHVVALRTIGVTQLNAIWIEEHAPAEMSLMITLELEQHGVMTHTVSAPTFLSWDEELLTLSSSYLMGRPKRCRSMIAANKRVLDCA